MLYIKNGLLVLYGKLDLNKALSRQYDIEVKREDIPRAIDQL